MGTPEFAVASLRTLVEDGCNIVAVITAPDKPAGRGMQLQQSAVKQYALHQNIPILQPEKLKNPDFLAQLSALKADLQVVVAFRMLPELVWNQPPMGTINVHGSLLPQYRGAAPINWAVINGESFTGVTTFQLKHEIDTGNILLQEKIPIGENETAGELHDRMKETGAALLLRTIRELAAGTITEIQQSSAAPDQGIEIKHAPKIFTADCEISWNHSVEAVFNFIRGLSPYPTAFTYLQGKKLKIYAAEKLHVSHIASCGTFETDHKTFLRFACTNGYLLLTDIQLEGKKRMGVQEFLRGYRFTQS